MYIINKSTMNGKHDHSSADTTAASLELSPSDPWLFTDPSARELYMQRDSIDRLEEDIRTYVMLNGCWAPEELEYKLEVQRLLREGLVAPMGSFGYLSPHPTAYRFLQESTLRFSGQGFICRAGEDLIFEPWLARYSIPGLKGPLNVGWFQEISSPCLCCDAFPDVCIHCDNTLAIMQKILNYRSNRK